MCEQDLNFLPAEKERPWTFFFFISLPRGRVTQGRMKKGSELYKLQVKDPKLESESIQKFKSYGEEVLKCNYHYKSVKTFK